MGKTPDLVGKRFGLLTVVRCYGKNKHSQILWECRCDCGKMAYPTTGVLLSNNSQSCGCIRRIKLGNLKRTHGESGTRLYKHWRDMKSRCYNPHNSDYSRYGGRGISVCNEWKDNFVAFRDWANANGYSETLTIDRIDVNGDYEPSNCRWADQYKQANNRTSNHFITYHGVTDTFTNTCRRLNVNYNTIRSRMRLGYSFEQAIDGFKKTSTFIEYWKQGK